MVDSSTIGLVAGSSVLAAALTQGSSTVKEWLKRRRDAGFSALYAALALEEYAWRCSTTLSQSEVYEDSDGQNGIPHASLPEKPIFPKTIYWDFIGIIPTTDCLSLLLEIDLENQRISGSFDFGDNDDGVMEVRRSCINIGLQAFALAKSLREQRNLKPRALNEAWNFFRYLEERKQHYADIAQDRAA